MDIEFDKQELQDLYSGNIKGKPKYSASVIKQYIKLIKKIKFAKKLDDLAQIKGLRLEKLKGDKKGMSSLSANMQYRLEFIYDKQTKSIIISNFSKHYEN